MKFEPIKRYYMVDVEPLPEAEEPEGPVFCYNFYTGPYSEEMIAALAEEEGLDETIYFYVEFIPIYSRESLASGVDLIFSLSD